jgi:four helix bundle protein
MDLKMRSKKFALSIIHLYSCLPRSSEAQILGKQLLRAGTSVGSHYREGVRARSDAEFISKLEGALQELEESIYWMELIEESSTINQEVITPLIQEADELIAIFITCVKNVKAKRKAKMRNIVQ